MDTKKYFDCSQNSKFILDFDKLSPTIHQLNKQSFLELPYPTKKEIQAFTPLTHNQITHIAHVLVTHQNIRQCFSFFVPQEIPENIFWCKYFRLLFTVQDRESDYKKYIKHRDNKRSDSLTHVLQIWKVSFSKMKLEIPSSLNPKQGLLLLTGSKEVLDTTPKLINQLIKVVFPFASTKSNMFKRTVFILTSPVIVRINIQSGQHDIPDIDLPIHQLEDKLEPQMPTEVQSERPVERPRSSIGDCSRQNTARVSLDSTPMGILSGGSLGGHIIDSISERPRMSFNELQRNSITNSESDIPAHRFLIATFNTLFNRMKNHKLQFVGPLLGFLVKHYQGIEAYVICHTFICSCLYRGIYPFTVVQFDYFFLMLDDIVCERMPNYAESLTVSLTTIYENLFVNLLVPLLDDVDKFISLTILQHLFLYGYPFAVKLVVTMMEESHAPPKRMEEVVPIFKKVLEYDAPGILALATQMKLPDFANYHFLFSIKESVHSTVTPFTETDRLERKMTLEKMCSFTLPTDLMCEDLLLEFTSMLPNRFAVMDFMCLFSTKTDGFSLRNLYSLCAARNPLVIFIQAENGDLFGGYLPDPIKIHRNFYGTGEAFLFTLVPKVKKYKATMSNTFYVMTDLNKLIMGGGRGFPGLSISKDMEGQTYECPTFNNEPLTINQQFKIQRLEVWTAASVALISTISESVSEASSSRQSMEGL
ncbi:hypothetical protein EIN_176630 [Entamoeba invadens IP1]|uniref:hypothetical protein n=1 Tax=Entamoeba invadens IP1 TaxID=370355 RepID=UPI0002C3E62F|nr:hypothetical protein EIN_176630 [Entamoeba invadens IP1]ELP93836.1 hypothetical protein EIN_176630 [Entamoeba invadens IP1]|eukprot:XP_004260607.1 hypothetical protein EIN_176630 [Entamoeba invadens IP1]